MILLTLLTGLGPILNSLFISMVISFIDTKEKYLKIELKPEKENMHSEIYSMI